MSVWPVVYEADAPDGDAGYPLQAWVVVDGVRFPCTPEDLGAGIPTILDGLSFNWGRESTVDQPDTETLTFTIREQLTPQGVGVNVVDDPEFDDPDRNAARFPATFTIDDGTVTIPAPADGYRIWLIGNRMSSASSAGPPGKAPGNGAMSVITGQVFEFSILVTASVDRKIRWQVNRYDGTGTVIPGVSYVDSGTQVFAGVPFRFVSTFTIPDDGTAYMNVSFVTEGGYGGTVAVSGPAIELTDTATTLDVIHVGSDVQVWTGGEIPSDDTGNTVLDVDFAAMVDGPVPTNRYANIAGEPADITVEDDAAWFTRTGDYDWASTVAFSPLPFADDGTNPDAWDSVARLLPGQAWPYTATVWVPPGAGVRLAAYAYVNPHKTPAPVAAIVVDDDDDPVSVVGDGGWHTIGGNVSLPAGFDAAGAWIAAGLVWDPMPAALTWAQTPGAWSVQTPRWMDLNRGGASRLTIEQVGPSEREVLVWAGQVTTLVGQAAGDHAFTTAVTASDLSAILANLKVGDEPWQVESVEDRAGRIMALVPTAPAITVDTGLQGTNVSYRDVDAQPPLSLLQDLAQTAGGVMWVTAHATLGVYLWMEDIDGRASVRRFVIADGTNTVSIEFRDGSAGKVAVISARDVLRDPVAWTQDVSQVITQVTVGWLEQLVDEDGLPTTEEHSEITQAEQAIVDRFGLRDMSVSTELITAVDAGNLASRTLAQARNTGWIASGVNLDTILLERDIPTVEYPRRLAVVLDLLDATRRIGAAITLTELPEWTPPGAVASVYVEGGTYTWSDHRWELELTVSPAAGQGESARWEDFAGTPARWSDFRTNRITWSDAFGTAGPDQP